MQCVLACLGRDQPHGDVMGETGDVTRNMTCKRVDPLEIMSEHGGVLPHVQSLVVPKRWLPRFGSFCLSESSNPTLRANWAGMIRTGCSGQGPAGEIAVDR